MKTVTLVATQEDIVRNYFAAFVSHDVNRMIADLHPALHYIRSVNGKLETVMNGVDDFRQYMEHYTAQLNEQTLELTNARSEADFIDMHFGIDTQPLSNKTAQHLTGRVVFWFMEGKIFQIVSQIDTGR